MAVDDAYTVSLLHFDGNLTDESGKTWTAYGGASTSTTQKKFGTSAIALLGDGQISTPSASDLQFGTGSFSFDCWVYITSTAPWNVFVWKGASFFFAHEAAVGVLFRGSGGDVVVPYTFPINTWTHLYLGYDGSKIYIGINGTVTSTNYSHNDVDTTTPWSMGRFLAGGQPYSMFYADELRISKGVARWTSNFTPPTAPYGVGGAHLPPIAFF